MIKYKISLTPKAIQKLIDDLNHYRDHVLPQMCNEFNEALKRMGVEYVKDQIIDMDAIWSGELFDSIEGETSSTSNVFGCVIQANCDYAVYVEMGTGIVGAKNPYPGKLPAIYAQGEKMFFTKDGKFGWIYKDREGKIHFTQGMPSRPFMYNTSLHLIQTIPKLAKQIFRWEGN